jgi:hypothetical protein
MGTATLKSFPTTSMNIYIALVNNEQGFDWIYGKAPNWSQYHDQLEDLGYEVIENQTDDWEGYSEEQIAEDCMSIEAVKARC